MTRKEIVKALDRAAAKADARDLRGASSKQTWFMSGLIADLHDEDGIKREIEDYVIGGQVLTMISASEMIEHYISMKARFGAVAA